MLTATSCISLSRAFKPSEKQWTLVRRQRLSSLLEELVQQRRDRATSIRTVIPTNATEETASMASSKDDVVGTVVTPSIVNKPWVSVVSFCNVSNRWIAKDDRRDRNAAFGIDGVSETASRSVGQIGTCLRFCCLVRFFDLGSVTFS